MKGLFVRTKEKQYGPLSEYEFRRMIFEGRVTAEDLVWHYYSNIWVKAGKIEKFKPLFPNNRYLKKKKIIAVGSGKGGVGKTALTASIGVQLAILGKKVVLVDADFGSPNLHQWMGINQPPISLQAFFGKHVAGLEDVAIATQVQNLRIICGAPGNLGIANLKHFQTLRFIKLLHSLDADFVFVDLSPGASYKVIDLFLAADESIVVTLPEPAAIFDAFTFLKICLLREMKRSVKDSEPVRKILDKYEASQTGSLRLSLRATMAEIQKADERAWSICVGVLKSFKPKLVLNMVFHRSEDREGHIFKAALAKLLLIQVDYLGYVEFDYNARKVSKNLRPFILADPKFKASKRLANLSAGHLVNEKRNGVRKQTKEMQRTSVDSPSSVSSPTVCGIVFGDVVEAVELSDKNESFAVKFDGITSLNHL